MAGTKWSDLVAVSGLNEADFTCFSQGGVNKQVTRSQLRKFLVDSPQNGDLLAYNSSTGDWEPGVASRWKTVLTTRYTGLIGATPSVITMSVTSDMAVGLPVRYVVSGTTYYGIVTAVTANTSITVAGPLLTAAATVSALAVGTPQMVIQIPLSVPVTGYAAASSSVLLQLKNNEGRVWSGPKAYCVRVAAAHYTASKNAVINAYINGSAVLTTGVTIDSGNTTTVLTWAFSTIAVDPATYDINMGEKLDIGVGILSSCNYLSVILTFVLE